MKENFEGQPEFRIEEARPDDAEAIQHVLYETWLATYPNKEEGITEDDIRDWMGDNFTSAKTAEFRHRIETMPEHDRMFVARDAHDVVVGVVTGVRCEDYNRLKQFYVLPEYQGRGVGTKLWEAAHAFLDPEKETRLNHVASYNVQAINFYTRLGFSDTGERSEVPVPLKSGKHLPYMTMVRPPDIFPFKPKMPL